MAAYQKSTRPDYSGDYSLEEISLNTLRSRMPMSVIAFIFIMAGAIVLIFTRLDYKTDLAHYYSQEEDFSHIMPHIDNTSMASAGSFLLPKQRNEVILSYLQTKLQSDPANDTLHYYAGICYLRSGRADEAIRCFTRVSRHMPDKWQDKAEFYLGIAYWQSGNMTQAHSVLRKISRQPNHLYREKASRILREKASA